MAQSTHHDKLLLWAIEVLLQMYYHWFVDCGKLNPDYEATTMSMTTTVLFKFSHDVTGEYSWFLRGPYMSWSLKCIKAYKLGKMHKTCPNMIPDILFKPDPENLRDTKH